MEAASPSVGRDKEICVADPEEKIGSSCSPLHEGEQERPIEDIFRAAVLVQTLRHPNASECLEPRSPLVQPELQPLLEGVECPDVSKGSGDGSQEAGELGVHPVDAHDWYLEVVEGWKGLPLSCQARPCALPSLSQRGFRCDPGKH